MKIMSLALCGFALTLAACLDQPAADSPANPSTSEAELDLSSQTMSRQAFDLKLQSASPAADTCTWTQIAACRVGQCELGPNDSFDRWKEVCCNAAGSCTTTNWRICGCL